MDVCLCSFGLGKFALNVASESKECCSSRVCSWLHRILWLALLCGKTEVLALCLTAVHAGVVVHPGCIVSVLGPLPFFPSGTCLKSEEKLCLCVK